MGKDVRNNSRVAFGVFLLGLAFALGSIPRCAEAARFTLLSPSVIAVEDRIDRGDCTRWKAALAPTVTDVVLNSPGGLVVEGQCISISIAERNLTTHVYQRCSSICFLLFAAGATKWACDTANIGVHHTYFASSGEEDDMSEVLLYARIYGVPATIRQQMSETPPRAMYWLSASDLAAMNVWRCPVGTAGALASKADAVPRTPDVGALEDCSKRGGTDAAATCMLVSLAPPRAPADVLSPELPRGSHAEGWPVPRDQEE